MKKTLSIVCLLLALSNPVHATVRSDCHIVQIMTFAVGMLFIAGGLGTIGAAQISSDFLVPTCEKSDEANCCLAPVDNSTKPQDCVFSKESAADCGEGKLLYCKRGNGYVDPLLKELRWIHPVLILGTVVAYTGFLTMFTGCYNLCKTGNSPTGALTMHNV